MRRHPAAHFALLGALLFGLTRWLGVGAAPPPRLALDPASADALRQSWIARTGQAPTAAEWNLLHAEALDEEALYRAALATGLDRDDPVVQGRILRNMRFVTEEPIEGAALYRDARRLGLADTDLVVRRRLIERMRLLLQAPALAAEPSDAELHAYLEAHADRFATAARVRLSQVFLSRQRRGAALVSDARRLLERLHAADAVRAGELGDPLPVPAQLPSASEQDLARSFGADFARAAFALEPGRWQGPLASPYGLHLIWVHEHVPAAQPALAAVRSAVRAALLEERAATALRAGVRGLRDEVETP